MKENKKPEKEYESLKDYLLYLLKEGHWDGQLYSLYKEKGESK